MSEVVEPWQPWWLSQEAAQLELGEGGTRLVAPLAAEGKWLACSSTLQHRGTL